MINVLRPPTYEPPPPACRRSILPRCDLKTAWLTDTALLFRTHLTIRPHIAVLAPKIVLTLPAIRCDFIGSHCIRDWRALAGGGRQVVRIPETQVFHLNGHHPILHSAYAIILPRPFHHHVARQLRQDPHRYCLLHVACDSLIQGLLGNSHPELAQAVAEM